MVCNEANSQDFSSSNFQVNFIEGYFPSIMLGGYLTSKFGGVLITSLSIGLSSIGTLLFPVAARWNVIALLICRVLTGFAQVTKKVSSHKLRAI